MSSRHSPPSTCGDGGGPFPRDFKIGLKQMIGAKIEAKMESRIEDVKESVQQSTDDLRARIKALQVQLNDKLQAK